jgi:cell shape-determining protein MreD
MTILFYTLVSLCLVVVKTTLIPSLPLLVKFYDLLIPIVVYLGFFRSLKEGIPLVLFFGIVMDGLSGGPAGLYTITYSWLYVAILFLSQVLHSGNWLLLAVAVACGVVFEVLILLFYIVFLAPTASMPVDAVETIVLQIIWALTTGPLILMIIHRSQKQIDRWRTKIFADW